MVSADEQSDRTRILTAMSTDPALAALARVRMATSNRAKERYRPVVSPTLSSAVPDDRDPQLLGRCVDTWVRGNGYGHEIAVAGLADRWQAIVGPQVADHVSVQGFTPGPRGGELIIVADAAEWAVQLKYLVPKIQQRIDEELGAGVVTNVIVRGPGRTTTGGWRVRTGRRSPRLNST